MKKWIAGGMCVLSLSLAARADDSAERFERLNQEIQRDQQVQFDAELPPANRALIDYGGYLTLGYLSFDDSAHDNHGLRQYELIGYGRVNLDGANEFYARGRADYDDYNAGTSFANEPSTLSGRMEEGWYRFDLRRAVAARGGATPDYDLSVKAGRQFVDWGNGLTLDQYADGVLGQFRNQYVVLDALACVTVKETIDFDFTRPDFDHNTHRGYYGARLTLPIGKQNPYAFFLLQRDYNRGESSISHDIPTRYLYDSYYAGVGSNGALGDHLAYAAEACYEGGHDLSNSYSTVSLQPVSQSDDRIEAAAANVRLEYLLNDSRKTKLTAEFIFASGDGDRGSTSGTFEGNRPHTADNAYNGLGVIYDSLAFAPQVSNIMVFRMGGSTYPLPRGWLHGLQAGADFFVFAKALRDGAINEPANNDHYLGVEPDAFIDWRITDDVTFAARYGVFFPGDAIPSGDQKQIRQFLYLAVTYAF